MISKDKTYRTRDGREVRIYATDGGDESPVHGAAWDKENNEWELLSWTEDGYLFADKEETDMDLIEVKPRHKRTVWLNVYDNEVIHGGWKTKDDAEQYRHKHNCIACIKVDLDFEEGEGITHGTYVTVSSGGGSPNLENGGGFTPSPWIFGKGGK